MYSLEEIIEQLSRIMDMPLSVDEAGTCSIRFLDQFLISIQQHPQTGDLLVSAEIGQLPPGRYREEILRAGLIANAMPEPRTAVFAYSKKTNTFIAFRILPMATVAGEELHEALLAFLSVQQIWVEALDKGQLPTPPEGEELGAAGQGGMFGLTP